MFRSVVTKTSNPAASAASRSSPFPRVSQPRERPLRQCGPSMRRLRLLASRYRTEFASTLGNGNIQASSGKFQYRLDLSPSDRELLDHLVNGHAVLQVFKDDGHGGARSREDPRTAHLARNAFNARTLRPVERGHYGASLHHPVYGICAWRSHRTLTHPNSCTFLNRSPRHLANKLLSPVATVQTKGKK